jgi:transposase
LIRTTLTDAQWKIIAPHCLGRECDPGRTGPDPRLFVEAVLWIAKSTRRPSAQAYEEAFPEAFRPWVVEPTDAFAAEAIYPRERAAYRRAAEYGDQASGGGRHRAKVRGP